MPIPESLDDAVIAPNDHLLYARIGLVVVNFGSLETNLHTAFKVLIKVPGDLEWSILGPVQSIGARIDIIMGTARELDGRRPIARVLLEGEHIIRDFVKLRNTLAHSSYVQVRGIPYTASWLTDPRRKAKLEPIDQSEIVRQCTAVLSVMRKLQPHINRWAGLNHQHTTKGPLAALHGKIFDLPLDHSKTPKL